MGTQTEGRSRLLKIFRSMSFVTCLMAASVAHGNDAPDPCVKRSDITDATLTLESSRLETSGLFIGLFRIENHDSDKAFHFRGFTVSGETRIVGPERSIEYLDGIAHEWRPVLDLRGRFHPEPTASSCFLAKHSALLRLCSRANLQTEYTCIPLVDPIL
jgi:hypothetical protein